MAVLGQPFNKLTAEPSTQTHAAEEIRSDQLVEHDTRLRQLAFRQFRALDRLPAWRSSLSPPESAWWWRLDLQFAAGEQERDLPWYLGAAFLTSFSLALSIEIIRRLWSRAPDIIAVFGSILPLLLTGGPLLKRGPELGQWVLRRIPRLSPRYRGEMSFAAAGLAFIGVLICWLSLPFLGLRYNNLGYSALASGELAAAEQWFTRATVLNPELAVPYYNLAAVYEESGAPEEAIAWFRKAISYDRQFRPSYYRLGAIYNRQGDYAQAEQVLLAGLNISSPGDDQLSRALSDYLLLSNLGWALFSQGRFAPAEIILQDALLVEPSDPANERRALPHYALAHIACQLDRPDDARREIEETLRFGDPGRRESMLWAATVNAYLDGVQAGASPCATLPMEMP